MDMSLKISQYLVQYHDHKDEPVAEKMFDWELMEVDLSAA